MDNAVSLLRTATEEQPERSLLWREMLSRYDVNDVASLVFRDGFGCWGFLDLWRIRSGPRFSEVEETFLRRIAAGVTAALRRSQARTFDLESLTPERSGPIVVMLSAELEVKAQTPETEEYLRILVPPEMDRRPIPAGAYHVAAQLLVNEGRVSPGAGQPTSRT